MAHQSRNQKYQLLEINLISAFDLEPPRSVDIEGLKTYAVLWIDPKQKHRSLAVAEAVEPKWNEKFVFIVDSETLNSITPASLFVEIYCTTHHEDDEATLLGSCRVLLGGLGNRNRHCTDKSTGTFRGFHVRRHAGDVGGGVLNIGATVLEGLPISDDQLIATGLAIDCKKIAGTSKVNATARTGVRSGVTALLKGLSLSGRFLLREKLGF